MRILRLNEMLEMEYKIGDVVKMKQPPRSDLIDAEFIIKVDLGYEAIMYQVKPGLTEEEIKIVTDTPHFASGELRDEVHNNWRSLPYLKGDCIPMRIAKHRLIKVR